MKKYIYLVLLLNSSFLSVHGSQLYQIGAVVFHGIPSDANHFKVIEQAKQSGYSFDMHNEFSINEKVLVPRSNGDLIIGSIIKKNPQKEEYVVQLDDITISQPAVGQKIRVQKKVVEPQRIGKFPFKAHKHFSNTTSNLSKTLPSLERNNSKGKKEESDTQQAGVAAGVQDQSENKKFFEDAKIGTVLFPAIAGDHTFRKVKEQALKEGYSFAAKGKFAINELVLFTNIEGSLVIGKIVRKLPEISEDFFEYDVQIAPERTLLVPNIVKKFYSRDIAKIPTKKLDEIAQQKLIKDKPSMALPPLKHDVKNAQVAQEVPQQAWPEQRKAKFSDKRLNNADHILQEINAQRQELKRIVSQITVQSKNISFIVSGVKREKRKSQELEEEYAQFYKEYNEIKAKMLQLGIPISSLD